ncbi:MAG: hypothetical protein ACREXP_24670, partial [Steroidobacteraceae bacterium]
WEHGRAAGRSRAGRLLPDRHSLIERDEPCEKSEARRCVPQGRHAHGLLLRGQDTICRLFHDVREELLAAGATPVNMGRDVKWFHFDVWKCRYHSALDFISASRPLIEWTVAERVRRLPNVQMLHGWAVESVIYERFYEVMHLLKPPAAMFAPDSLWKVATGRRPRGKARRALDSTRVAHHSH